MDYQELDIKMLKKFNNALKHDSSFEVLKNAIQKNGIADAIFSTQNTFKIQNVFNTEVEDVPILTDQKRSGRCWMFAGLSVISAIVKKNLKIKDIELSESYLMFYDKLEKCNTIFEYVINNINEKVDSRLFRYILGLSGEHDGGFWHYFIKLVKKYGICPKDVMGETYDSSNSSKMNQLISAVVTRSIYLMRENKFNKNLREIKENALTDIYKILSLCVGSPVNEFVFDYEVLDGSGKDDKEENTDKDKKDKKANGKEFKSLKTNPLEFAKNYLLTDIDDYVILCNYPGKKYKYMSTFTNKMNLNIIDNDEIKYKVLNVDIDIMKEGVIKSIKGNNPVWFGCDVTIDSTRSGGYLSTEIMDASKILNIDLSYDKTARIELLNTESNHAMVFTGVHLDGNNKPVRWKVQNSWGEETGKKGYFIMTDTWFTDYVYECVIKKEFLTKEIIKAYRKKPINLEPWNAII